MSVEISISDSETYRNSISVKNLADFFFFSSEDKDCREEERLGEDVEEEDVMGDDGEEEGGGEEGIRDMLHLGI